MDENNRRRLEQRLSQLETTLGSVRSEIDAIRAELHRDSPAPPPPAPRPTERPAAPPPPPPSRPSPGPPPARSRLSIDVPAQMRSWEYWLNKLGIGLLLFGVVFLFKYSIDQGWITPPVRIVFGLGLGVILIGLGLYLAPRRKHFATVLLGGGIATYYITGWAAIQVLGLWSYEIAIAFTSGTTLVSFLLSLRQDEVVLSLIAVAGGLATPVLLQGDTGGAVEYMVYVSMLILLAGAVYFFKGWRSLLWESIVGGWLVIVIGMAAGRFSFFQNPLEDRWAMQGAVIIALLMFWAVPVAREILLRLRPAMLRPESLGFADQSLSSRADRVMSGHILLWTISMPLVALLLSGFIWNISDQTWGWICLGATLPFFAVWLGVRTKDSLAVLAQIHLATALIILTTGLALLLEGNALYMMLAIEAVALHLAYERSRSTLLGLQAHTLVALLGIWFLFDRLGSSATSFFSADSIADYWFGLALLAVAWLTSQTSVRRIYLTGGLVLIGAVFARDLDPNLALVLVATELLIFHWLARVGNDPRLSDIGDFLALPVAFVLGGRLLGYAGDSPALVNARALADLFTLGVWVAIPLIVPRKDVALVYRIAVHAGLLVWFWRELSALPNGDGMVTVAWGLYGIAMLVVGLRRDFYRLRLVGLITLLLVVGKLFLVDLARIETIWRILLFLSFGGVFLVLSYYFKSLWKPPTKTASGANQTDSAGRD